MTLQEANKYGEELLQQAGIADATIDAWYLLEYVTGINRAMYFLNMQKQLSEAELEQYQAYLEQRKNHIPLQHITGVQEFMGMNFAVNEHVLIPRQDTEVLVEEALKVLQPGMQVLDMCTGSGCIIISLSKMGKIEGTGVDISVEALDVAKKNNANLDAGVTWIQSDLFENVEERYDMIVSNPPYIRTAVIEELKEEVKFHDPYIALDGKEDGLYFYRKIVEESTKYLKENGMLYFEIGHDQGQEVKNLMEESGFSEVLIKKDLAGLDRVVFGRYN